MNALRVSIYIVLTACILFNVGLLASNLGNPHLAAFNLGVTLFAVAMLGTCLGMWIAEDVGRNTNGPGGGGRG